MKLSLLSAVVVLALPLAVMAQTLPEKKAGLEEALRVQQFICNGIADVSTRGSGAYASDDLVRCRVALDAQRAEYQSFMAKYNNALVAAASATLHRSQTATANRTAFADAAH